MKETREILCDFWDGNEEREVRVVCEYYAGSPNGYRSSDGVVWDDDPCELELVEVWLDKCDILPSLDNEQIDALTQRALRELQGGDAE